MNPNPDYVHGGRGRLAIATSIATATFLAATTLLLPAHLAAQACLGSPATPGQTALLGSVTFNGDATGYGGDLRTNLPGQLALGIGGGVIDVDGLDQNIRQIRGDIAADLARLPDFSACPVVGISYSTWRDDFFETTLDLSELRVPVGVGIGTRLELAEMLAIIPSAVGGGYWYRVEEAIEFGDEVEIGTERDTGTELFGEAGLTLEIGQAFLRGAGLWDGREDDTVIRISVGFIF